VLELKVLELYYDCTFFCMSITLTIKCIHVPNVVFSVAHVNQLAAYKWFASVLNVDGSGLAYSGLWWWLTGCVYAWSMSTHSSSMPKCFC